MSGHSQSEQSANEGYPTLRENPSFLRLLFGRLVTNAGDSLYTVAAMWLVYDLTGSTVYTGITSAMLLLPMVLQFISGPLVDRWPIVRALVVIQLIQAVAILSLPVAIYTGNMTVELVLATIPFLALLNQFVYPAQSAALPQVVSDKQLGRANSAFSFTLNGLDMLFDAIGGTLIALIGAASLFVLDSVTFLIASLLFAGVKISAGETVDEEPDRIDLSGYAADFAEGIKCLRGSVFVETTLTSAVANVGAGMTFAILPAFAEFRGGPALYGAMLGALGIGSAAGAALASRLEGVKYGRIRIIGDAISCILWLGAVYSPWPPLAVVLFGLAWLPGGIMGVMSETLEQTVTPNHLLGRVASVTASVSMLTLPIGALLGGVVGSVIGTVNTMALAGLGYGLVSLYSAFRPRLRNLPAMNNIDPDKFNMQIESPTVSESSD